MPGRHLQRNPPPAEGDTSPAEGQVANVIFLAAIDAGLAHELSWATVWRIVTNLPDEDRPCPYCGGLLQRWSSKPGDRAWRCAACGRLHIPLEDGGRPDHLQAAEIGRQARESWRLAEARIAARLEHPAASEVA